MEVSRKALADLTRMALADLLRARRAWDEPPALQFMYREDCCGGPDLVAVAGP